MSFEEFENEMSVTATQIEMLRCLLIETVVVCVATLALCVPMMFIVHHLGTIVFWIIAAFSILIGADQAWECGAEIAKLKAYRQALDEWQSLFLAEACHA